MLLDCFSKMPPSLVPNGSPATRARRLTPPSSSPSPSRSSSPSPAKAAYFCVKEHTREDIDNEEDFKAVLSFAGE